MAAISFEDSEVLGRFSGEPDPIAALATLQKSHTKELRAAYEHITELKSSLAEMVSIYWGEGDGIEPAPACIQRAQAALAEEVR